MVGRDDVAAGRRGQLRAQDAVWKGGKGGQRLLVFAILFYEKSCCAASAAAE